jgi:hypothetical protein
MNKLSSSDLLALTKLASTLPVGSKERKDLLQKIATAGFFNPSALPLNSLPRTFSDEGRVWMWAGVPSSGCSFTLTEGGAIEWEVTGLHSKKLSGVERDFAAAQKKAWYALSIEFTAYEKEGHQYLNKVLEMKDAARKAVFGLNPPLLPERTP